MSKLKSYEIDAIVYTIQNQIKEINNNARRDELDPAEAKIAELIKKEKEACATLDKLRKARQELSNEAHPDQEVDSEGSEDDLNFREVDEWLEDLEDI